MRRVASYWRIINVPVSRSSASGRYAPSSPGSYSAQSVEVEIIIHDLAGWLAFQVAGHAGIQNLVSDARYKSG